MSGAQFTTLIRVPFPRGDFVDPQQVTWDATKDRTLWETISKSSRTSELNWSELADSFYVSPTFLLQQAAWLYERHLDHVRAQMKKVGGSTALATFSLENTHTTAGGVSVKRSGSGASGAYRAPPLLPARQKVSTMAHGEPITPEPLLSRTPSTNTITQARAYAKQPLPRIQPPRQRAVLASDRADPVTITVSLPDDTRSSLGATSPVMPFSTSGSSSSSDSDSENPAKRSQLFKRPPRFRTERRRKLISCDDAVDDGEGHGPATTTVLPFANVPRTNDIRINTKVLSRPPKSNHDGSPGSFRDATSISTAPAPNPSLKDGASSSGTSSASDAPRLGARSPSPHSPKHRAESAKPSPRKAALKRRDGSEGTPSMGSSFSDLDDASISQSALEEALLSNIQHGRMSTLSQLRSKYL